MDVLGLDVGGANIKAAGLRLGKNREIKTSIEYFPVWKTGKENLSLAIQRTVKKLGWTNFDWVGLTMTAELSDVYFNKVEGVNHVLDCVCKIFPVEQIFVLDVDGNLLTVNKARKKPYKVASANWMATGWLVSRHLKNCLVIDVGSTTTSIIPILNGKVAVTGKTDLEKLLNGELVYTGVLRTNVATIVDKVPVKNGYAKVSSEVFALTGDVHLILGNIKGKDYTTETADGRGKTRLEAMARIARIVCADLNMLTQKEIRKICEYIYNKQLEQIIQGIKKVLSRVEVKKRRNLPVVVTGLGGKFLAGKAVKKVGLKNIFELEKIVGLKVSVCTPAYGLALMVAEKIGF